MRRAVDLMDIADTYAYGRLEETVDTRVLIEHAYPLR